MEKQYLKIAAVFIILTGCFILTIPQAYGSSDMSYGIYRQVPDTSSTSTAELYGNRRVLENLLYRLFGYWGGWYGWHGEYKDLGYCQFYTSPYDERLGSGDFLMIVGDGELNNGFELEVKGTFRTNWRGSFILSPDQDAAEEFLQSLFASRLGDKDLFLDTYNVTVGVINPYRASTDEEIKCYVNINGYSIAGDGSFAPVKISFNGDGQHYKDTLTAGQEENSVLSSAVASNSAVTLEAATCDNPRQGDTIPFQGYDPTGACGGNNCIFAFAGYKWWTNYNYVGPSRGYFWDNDRRQVWSPRNAYVDNQGLLHLWVRRDNLGGGNQWASSEAVLIRNLNDSPAPLGYGTYLVSARIESPTSWDQLDRNVAFGAFTYQFAEDNIDNPHRELDLAEISRWGYNPPNNQCSELLSPVLCEGNAQFTLQDWQGPGNIHRYSLGAVQEITLVMEWVGAGQHVTFKQYNGRYDSLSDLESANPEPAEKWETSDAQNKYIPAEGCQFFHLNLWMGNYIGREAVGDSRSHPPPSSDQHVVVTGFDYRPLSP